MLCKSKRIRRRVMVPVLLLVGLLLIGACGQTPAADQPAADTAPQQGTPIEPPKELVDFSLPSSLGGELSLDDLQGKPTLLFFGYTFCPDVCPLTLSEFRKVREQLGEQGDQVNYLFISVDGERDTPERLATYLQSFAPTFIGLQGDEATLRRIGPDYGLYYKKNKIEGTSASYLVDHSSASYLLDGSGRMVMVYSYGMPPEVIAADLRRMLGQAGAER